MALKHTYILFFLLLHMTLYAEQIRVAVAANASHVMEDLKQTFSKMHPEVKVEVILGSSGKLTAQILHGAPYDVFMSADMQYPQTLYAQKFALSKPEVYAQGTLSLLSQKKRDFSSGMYVLKDSDIGKIAIANPKTAPYGKAAKEALEHVKLYSELAHKFVYGESISQTLSYVMRAADIGLVATSALYAPQMKAYQKNIHWSEVDTTFYTPINQGMVILKQAKESNAAKMFYDFMLSAKAKEILKQFGYKVL